MKQVAIGGFLIVITYQICTTFTNYIVCQKKYISILILFGIMISVPLFLIQSYPFLHFFRSNAKKQCFFQNCSISVAAYFNFPNCILHNLLSLYRNLLFTKYFKDPFCLLYFFFYVSTKYNNYYLAQFFIPDAIDNALMGRMVANSWLVLLLLTMACNPFELSLESSINKAR